LQKLAQAQARACDAQETARRVVDLIQATISCQRAAITHDEVLRRIDVATRVVSGAIPPDMYVQRAVTEAAVAR
jgi:hypothetical protein